MHSFQPTTAEPLRWTKRRDGPSICQFGAIIIFGVDVSYIKFMMLSLLLGEQLEHPISYFQTIVDRLDGVYELED